MSQLELALVPIYLFHRYQTEAAIKEIVALTIVTTSEAMKSGSRDCVPADQRKASQQF